MVFHITNYMRETNVWMIRKMRWIFWSIGLSIPIYRNVYWDYLGRRTAWKAYWSGLTEDEKIQKAEEERANWGFNTRYDAKYPFSIKTAKYATQTREETFRDMPRLRTKELKEEQFGRWKPKDVRTIVAIASEHNR